MQLFALNEKGGLVSALQAGNRERYFCLECQGHLRVRGGLHRQRHFYHLDPPKICRQHQKGMTHLQLQSYLYRLIGEEDCQLEFRMPQINRIADVAWLSKKMVFEIQCSPISAAEVQRRNQDYSREGWTVIWILHDRRFNQLRYSAVEEALRSFPHYYSNMDHQGNGFIYDQFDHFNKGFRQHKLGPLPIDPRKIEKSFQKMKSAPKIVTRRLGEWPLYFSGDLTDCTLQNKEKKYLSDIFELERVISQEAKRPIITSLLSLMVHPYKVMLRYFLEKTCR